MTTIGGPSVPQNAVFTYDGTSYFVPATSVKTANATTLLLHLRSKNFAKKYKDPVPESLIIQLEAEAERESAARKLNGKRKLSEFLEKRKLKGDEYENLAADNPSGFPALYTRLEHDTRGTRFACHACRQIIPASGFSSHPTTLAHKEGLAAKGSAEDTDFIDSHKDLCNQAAYQASKTRHCEPCEKDILLGNWDQHVRGRPHIHKAAAAGGQDVAPVAEDVPAASGLPSTLSYGEVSLTCGDTLLDKFDPEHIPLFVAGEDMWALGKEFLSAEVAYTKGVELAFCLRDADHWGCMAAPALAPTLLRNPTHESMGVCYIMHRSQVQELVQEKKLVHENLRMIFVTHLGPDGTTAGQPSHDALLFTYDRGFKLKNDVDTIARGIGPKGPNYSLLVRIVHEHQKLRFCNPDLESLLSSVELFIWSQMKTTTKNANKPEAGHIVPPQY
eukprot:TRINITY_DN2874_c0_g2_i1.p1 TRINITY_DN2874_c0_g2~~TRINITY_DN2874_c0_g2_i1.p1  ORF type:complete len:445 (+),score=141.00 TRINITY_DN2874_c0_g2_i1:73-1407(+)